MEHSQISCDRVWEIDLDAVETEGGRNSEPPRHRSRTYRRSGASQQGDAAGAHGRHY